MGHFLVPDPLDLPERAHFSDTGGTFGEHLSHASADSPLLLALTWHLR